MIVNVVDIDDKITEGVIRMMKKELGLLFDYLSYPFIFCCCLILLQPGFIADFLVALLLSECDKHQSRQFMWIIFGKEI